MISKAVAISKSWREVCDNLGIKAAGSTQGNLKATAKLFGIDASHFPGHGSNKGRKFGPKRSVQSYLETNSSSHSHYIKIRLLQEGLKEAKCEKCGLVEWMGHSIPLELHHINQVHNDNRFENLQILCPNCHSLEPKRKPT